jgi:ectoine hydroxylase-related dioxygenase (phytanoyl-CoA dioxygenase family)
MDDDWLSIFRAGRMLSTDNRQALRDVGFVIIPGPIAPDQLTQFADAYDSAVACAASEDISVGSSTTRVQDFVNRGAEFDALYIYEPILEACCRIIGQPFKLSTMHARTVRPYTRAQNLHVDFKSDENGWAMLGFIFMVDEFRKDNGATRFVSGSHQWTALPANFPEDTSAHFEGQAFACGPAGSVIVYNGSVCHGHSANLTHKPRRSIQGAYIRRDGEAAVNQAARIRPDTLARIGEIAKYVLAI